MIVTFPTAPRTVVTDEGEVEYSGVVRENVGKLEAYVQEMASGDSVSGNVNIQKLQDDVWKLWTVVKSLPEINNDQKNRIKALYDESLHTQLSEPQSPHPGTRSRHSSSQFLRPQITGITSYLCYSG